MSTTVRPATPPATTPVPPSAPTAPSRVQRATKNQAPRRRSPVLIGLGVAMIAIFGLLGAYLATAGRDVKTVVVARTDIDAGTQIGADQLTTTEVSGSTNAETIAGEDLRNVVGAYASQLIPSGSILNPATTTRKLTPAPNRAILGVGLKPNQMPAIGLNGGDKVTLITTAAATQGAAVKPGQEWTAVVLNVGPVGDDGARTVDFDIASTDLNAAATAAGSGSMAAVLTGVTNGSVGK